MRPSKAFPIGADAAFQMTAYETGKALDGVDVRTMTAADVLRQADAALAASANRTRGQVNEVVRRAAPGEAVA